MKQQADKQCLERSFEVGDMVYLKLQPYLQMSVARRSNDKRSYRYFGPYKVLARVGVVAYKLELSPTSAIHPVIHVSQLKKAIPPTVQASDDASLGFMLSDESPVPPKLLQHKLAKMGNTVDPMVLVQWTVWSSDWVTWENLRALQEAFPCAPVWGQPGSQAEGSVLSMVKTHMEAQQVDVPQDKGTDRSSPST